MIHDFETIENHSFELFPEGANARYADWLVAFVAEAGLYKQTQADAFAERLQQMYGREAAKVLHGNAGEDVVAVNPANGCAIAFAVKAAPTVEGGFHFNEALWITALEEAVNDHWDDLSDVQRLELVKAWRNAGESLALAFETKPPDSVRVILQERFEEH
jgi:hypothetical protein